MWTTRAAPVDQGRLGFPTVAHRPHAQDGVVLTVEEASRRLQPSLVVLNAVTGERVRPALAQLRGLAGRHRLVLGGYVQVSLGRNRHSARARRAFATNRIRSLHLY